MTDYPNREHRVADEAALRRALANLESIETAAGIVRQKLLRRPDAWVDGSDARLLAVAVGQLTENLQILETLREVRGWHAADLAELQAELLKFKPEPMSQNCRDGLHNSTGEARCIDCKCLCHRAEVKS